MNVRSSASSGGLVCRNYEQFSGVDFSNRKDEVQLNRSPDAVNVWKNYRSSNGKCIETRPSTELVREYTDTIYGLYLYNNDKIVHSGTKLYKNETEIYDGLAEHKSVMFIFNSNLYILDGTNYMLYDGLTVDNVVGTIPVTTLKLPSGNGSDYEKPNMLSDYRYNFILGDGVTTEYYLNEKSIDNDFVPIITVNDIEVTEFTVDYNTAKITFSTAPDVPLTEGQYNVSIKYKKVVANEYNKIANCTIVEIFDNRIFFTGNPNYKNIVFHSMLNDAQFVSSDSYYTEGDNGTAVKTLITGNNSIWAIKEPGQTNTSIFYHNPSIADEYGKVYPSVHSSVATGCVSKGINFNDSICFFSENGLERITGDITTEQVIRHCSTMIDTKLLNEVDYKNLDICEWEGYLIVSVGKNIYLADSRGVFRNNDRYEYEWFYFEFNENISQVKNFNDILYIMSGNKLYTLTNTSEDRKVSAYFTTVSDEFSVPHMLKTTNKKASVIDIDGYNVEVSVKTDNNSFVKISTYNSKDKGYIKPIIKAKKFKSIQLKFSSEMPFSLYSATLEAYIGNMVKR
jgi:hypothetical protein